jgi:hypothetical protein
VNAERLRNSLWIAACLVATVQMVCAADYVGRERCATCHKPEYEKQSASHHAQALSRIDGSLVAQALLKVGHSPDKRIQYAPAASGIAAKVEGLPDSAALEWAFGAGVQGSTPVGRLNGQYFEHQFSYYARIQGLATTFGHAAHVSSPVAELGILQDNLTISRCFNCHSTGVPQSVSGPDLNGMLPGVQCERCHGPGSTHIQAAENGAPAEFISKQVVNPGRFPAKALIQICGQCHRLPEPDEGDRPELGNPVNVRFAPVGLLASRCFQGSVAISCVTCHDPHQDARPRTDLFYTRRCLDCHRNDHKPVRACERREGKNCLPCHMKQASLGPYLRFTDHRIRVYE